MRRKVNMDDRDKLVNESRRGIERGAVIVHRQSRLAGDYDEVMENRWPEEMQRLEKFVATLGGQVEIKHIDPAYRKFVFDIYIPTLGLINGREQDIDRWELTITVPAQYPGVHPKLTTRPPLFLPHARPDDGWLCVEKHRLDSTIAEYLEYAIKMATGQDVINTNSAANNDAMAQRNRIQERVRYDPWANAPQGSGTTRVMSAPTEFVPQQALSRPSGRVRVMGPGQANAAGVRVIGQGQNNGAEGIQQQEQGPIFRVRARR